MSKYIRKTCRVPLRYPLNLQLFAEAGAGAGGEGGSGGNGGNDGGSGGSGGAGGGEKTFTQAEVDAMFQQRLPRAEKTAQKALAKDLGFDSVEAMQAALKKDKGSDKAPKDKGELDPADIDKVVDERIKERQKEQDEKTFKRLLVADVKVLANELGFADWEDAYALADLSAVKENDKGELEGVKEALEALAKKKPHLLKAKQGSGRVGADIGGGGAPEDKKRRHEEMANLAKSRGAIGGQAAFDPWKK